MNQKAIEMVISAMDADMRQLKDDVGKLAAMVYKMAEAIASAYEGGEGAASEVREDGE
jgi:hypothetical protein